MAEDATDYGIKYRKQGDSEWIRVAAQTTRAARTEFTVSLTGLEPNTTYEYAAYASGYDDGEIQTITTESVFVILIHQWKSGENIRHLLSWVQKLSSFRVRNVILGFRQCGCSCS